MSLRSVGYLTTQISGKQTEPRDSETAIVSDGSHNLVYDSEQDAIHHLDVFDPPQHAKEEVVNLYAELQRSGRACFSAIDLEDGRFLKTGGSSVLKEGRAMEFVRTHTTIPVPLILMAFECDNRAYLVMERIDGDCLGVRLRPSSPTELSPEAVHGIAVQLHAFIEQLAQLDSTISGEHLFGSWPGLPYHNVHFRPDILPGVPSRMLTSDEEFHAHWIQNMALLSEKIAQMIAQAVSVTSPLEPRGPFLTHGDLHTENILVRGEKIVGILDWDTFGWYPRFWEFMALRRGMYGREWRLAVADVFGTNTPVDKAYIAALDTVSASR